MAEVKNSVLFVIDGMRPDGLQEADTPTLDRLIESGAHTLDAQTIMPSSTLPCHASLFLGVGPERHGITTNAWTPQVRPVPGLADVIDQAGHRTAFFYNWEPLRDLVRPGALKVSFFVKNYRDPDGVGDVELAELAAGWLNDHPIDFAFVYLGYTDIAGHDHGWMSAPYLAGIANADRCIQKVLDVLPEDGFVIVTSDHGGHEKTHGTDCPEDLTIPLVLSGPGIPAGRTIERGVHITDIAPTLTHLLGLETPAEWTGRAIELT